MRISHRAKLQIARKGGLLITFLSLLLVLSCGTSSSVLDLPAGQSMSVTGKGPGQDAAFNPFSESNSVAVVKNLGPNPFFIRIQDKTGNYEETRIIPKETLEVFLPMGYELYLDSDRASRAKVSFRKTKEVK
jgi:hypothetical protein